MKSSKPLTVKTIEERSNLNLNFITSRERLELHLFSMMFLKKDSLKVVANNGDYVVDFKFFAEYMY